MHTGRGRRHARPLVRALGPARCRTRPGLSADAMLAASARGGLDAFWMVGGNFLETVANARAHATRHCTGRACASITTSCCRRRCSSTRRTPCWCCPRRRVTRRPAAAPRPRRSGGSSSRRKSPDGGSAARARVVGARRSDGAREAGGGGPAALRATQRPSAPRSRVPFRSTPGIETLQAAGDQVQWGGPRLFDDGLFATADGRARVQRRAAARTPAGARARSSSPPAAASSSTRWCSTRSIRSTGAPRDAVLMSPADAAALGAADGTRVRLVSAAGTFEGRASSPRFATAISRCTGLKRLGCSMPSSSTRSRVSPTTTRSCGSTSSTNCR